jgi:hypothetical protein
MFFVIMVLALLLISVVHGIIAAALLREHRKTPKRVALLTVVLATLCDPVTAYGNCRPANYLIPATYNLGNYDCIPCTGNTYSYGGTATACTDCPANTLNSGMQRDALSVCKTISGWTGTASQVTSCPPATFKAQSGSNACGECPANSVVNDGERIRGSFRTRCMANKGYKGIIPYGFNGAPTAAIVPCPTDTYKASVSTWAFNAIG